jgi:putative membrane protein
MLWIKAFHIFGVVCWFAGVFYLPRLFVYHAMAEDAVGIERFKVMERKLYRGIMTPSAVFAVVFGLWLLVLGWEVYSQALWLWIKLVLVALLIAYHLWCGRIITNFANDANRRSHTFYRVFNEMPIFVLLGAIILAVVRPF